MYYIQEVNRLLDAMKRIAAERQEKNSTLAESALNMDQLYTAFYDHIKDNIQYHNEIAPELTFELKKDSYEKAIPDFIQEKLSKNLFLNLILHKEK